jgi:two-component system sensor histidine kinase/response regulator
MLNNKRILVVDDDEISRLVAAEVLGHLGAAVDLAATPEEAMCQVGRHRYDLIMLDLHMPEMSGIELAKTMTALDCSLTERLALLTGGGPAGSSEEAPQRSELHVFTKPLQPETVLKFIARREGPASHQIAATNPPARQDRDFPDIDGVDIAAGIRNFLGQEQSFFSTLCAFPDYSQKLLSDLARNLTNDNAKEYIRLAHSLKGSSAMIGAFDIHAVAKEIEASGHDRQHCEFLFLSLEKLIQDTNRSIDACIRHRHHLFENC